MYTSKNYATLIKLSIVPFCAFVPFPYINKFSNFAAANLVHIIIKYVCYYLIVGIDKEIYGFPKCSKPSCLTILFVAKAQGKIRLTQYVNTAKNHSKPLSMHYKLCYRIYNYTTRFSSASFQPYGLL